MIKPGKVTCAGLVAIMMVLPNSLWKSVSARDNPAPVVHHRRSKNGPGTQPSRSHRGVTSGSVRLL